jgi:hypothetical protein
MFRLDANACDTRPDDSQFARRGRAEVDYPAPDERAAIGDPNGDMSFVSQVGHTNDGAEWQGSMGGGELLRLESFTAGGLP